MKGYTHSFVGFSILLVVLSLPNLSCTQLFGKSEDYLESADSLIREGECVRAIEILRPYLYRNSESYEAAYLLGQAFEKKYVESNDDNDMYLARYYYDRAKETAKTDKEAEAADIAYSQARSIMGKGAQSAQDLYESGERFFERGRTAYSGKLYLMSGGKYLLEKDYENSHDAFGRSVDLLDDHETKMIGILGLALSSLLEGNYPKYEDSMEKLPAKVARPDFCPLVDVFLIRKAYDMLSIEGEKKSFFSLSRTISPAEKDKLKTSFSEITDHLISVRGTLSNEESFLVGLLLEKIQEHLDDLEMDDLRVKVLETTLATIDRPELHEQTVEIQRKLSTLKERMEKSIEDGIS